MKWAATKQVNEWKGVQGQLPGAGRPENRARIQLTCSLTEFPRTLLALGPRYLTKSTRSFCSHSRATAAVARAGGTSVSVSPLITSSGPNAGCRPREFLTKNLLTYALFSQSGFNISRASGSGPSLSSQEWLTY